MDFKKLIFGITSLVLFQTAWAGGIGAVGSVTSSCGFMEANNGTLVILKDKKTLSSRTVDGASPQVYMVEVLGNTNIVVYTPTVELLTKDQVPPVEVKTTAVSQLKVPYEHIKDGFSAFYSGAAKDTVTMDTLVLFDYEIPEGKYALSTMISCQ